MDSIQEQITTLAQKVDLVYETLDRLYHNVAEVSDVQNPDSEDIDLKHSLRNRSSQKNPSDSNYRNRGYADVPDGVNYRQDTQGWVIAQQDVLIDSSGAAISHHQIKEQDLSPQIQIQRLTAQLTAAYNRIAALEEQLLANRWK